MKRKIYDGYRSFHYLAAGLDYKAFPLASQIERLGNYSIPLNERQQKKVERIFEDNIMISLRDHGFVMPLHPEHTLEYCKHGFTSFGYEGLSRSGLDAVFENFMDGIMNISSRMGLKWDDVIWNLGMRYCDIAQQDTVMIASNIFDLYRAKETGRIAIIPSLEAATALENEIDRVDILYGFGIRCMGITYNEANTLGSGLSEARDGGLTNFGRRVVKRMNQLGMVIDISHCGDQTSLDTIEASEKPVLITHAGARGLWNTPRMKPDEVLMSCAEKGGVIGILAAPNTTLTKSSSDHSIESVMEHFEYIVNLVGIDHVGFGPDTFFGDHVALQHAVDAQLSIGQSHSGEEFDESSYVLGLEDPMEAMSNIVKWLVVRGYSDTDIAKVTGGNVMRALSKIWVK
ncbi:dipeptidase [uncultured Brevibacillus sp.]|uniref:dipeptidase n=1 Tax=uncultured Brevibacillus sp. TaxID=169970 RepID=UPI0025974AB3|nr:membrane dipeptidase [uncultured Brevibacillus sp.]